MEAYYSATLLGWSVYLLTWLFVVYSFLGVVVETIFCLVRERILESRVGLLYLPLRPMYGVGGVACTLLLHRFQEWPTVVFLGAMLICTVVEYAAGSICDLAFGTLSWDYRDKPLHLHGKVCLEYSCYWGLLGCLAVYVLSPAIAAAVARLDAGTGETVLTVAIALVLASAVLTVAAWVRIGTRLGVLDAQERGLAVTVRETVVDRLLDRLAPDPLMINTFPRTRLARELMAHTGQQRLWIRWQQRQPATPAPRHSPSTSRRSRAAGRQGSIPR